MLASERRVTGPGANGLQTKHPGVTQILKPGRAVKIYVIDPRKFQERLEKYVGDLKSTGTPKEGQGKEAKLPSERKDKQIQLASDQSSLNKGNTAITPANPLNNKGDVSGPTKETDTGSASAANPEALKAEDKPKKVPPKRKARKKKAGGVKMRKESMSDEKKGAAELAFLMKETTTRTGRVSKSSTAAAASVTAIATTPIHQLSQPASPAASIFSFSSGQNSAVPSPSPSVSSVNSQGQRVKKREPPEMFRCQTCRKVYLGHTKLNLHFQKFPEHQKSEVPVLKIKPKSLVRDLSSVQVAKTCEELNNSGNNANNSNYLNISAAFLTNPVPTVTQSNVESQTDPIFQESPHDNHDHSDNTDSHNRFLEEIGGLTTFGPVSIRRITTINPDTLSDNCSSPKLPDYISSEEVQTASERIYNSTEMDPVFLQVSSPLRPSQDDLQPITVPDLCRTDESLTSGRSEYFNFQSDFNPLPEISQIPSELIGNGSCSQQSFNINSLENLLADSNSHSPIGQSFPSPPLRSRDTDPMKCLKIPSSCASNGSNFFSGPTTKCTAIQNSSTMSSSFTNNGSIPPVDEDSRDVCMNMNSMDDSHNGTENSLDGCEIQIQPSPASAKRRSIWEFVKEQIRMCGINQTCGEISEMAEKLSKVARDNFYPIREEEIERLGGTPPIIQVESPFISHLLDLPFGTYIFKEDGGIRKIIPPPTPVSSDLSLTGGVEVDIDKFLSPDMDLISLPHLTNLDFAAICNE